MDKPTKQNARVGIFNVRDFDHHREIIFQTAFDGGTDAQCEGRLLAIDPACFPNTRSVVRDRAHAIRTNVKSPLASDPNLNRIKLQLIEKTNSLAKLVQYHPRAQNVHMTCQQAVINRDGAQGGGCKVVLKNFSFAKQRFESEEDPARKIAITLMASVLFLTSEADDPNRSKAERDNADEILTVFNPADLTLYGISSDLASDGVAFLRLVDVHHPDPALLPRRLRQFTRELTVMYLEGRILHESNKGTVTAIILQTLASNAGKPFFGRTSRGRSIG